MHPIPSLDSGLRFPLELPLGKYVPLYGGIPGRSFRLRRHPETTSQSERGFRDGLSASHSFGNCIPFRMRIPGCGFHLMCHPETTSQSERGFRDGFSAWAAIGKARPTLRCRDVFFTPAPCIEFDSPRVWDSVDVAHGRLGFDNIASISGRGFARRIRVFASRTRTGFVRLPASSPARYKRSAFV